MSIKPEYAEKILNGTKHYEFRKVIFKDKNVKKIVIYATMPVGKVVGEFDIDDIIQEKPSSLWSLTKKNAGISREFFESYFNGRTKGFAIKIKNPEKYDEPYCLSSILPNGHPPQSFCYLR
ncbi:ASCH domain-containing protein [Photobacterium kishitanii]|uniref:ASCH domain-containing protein n=1 Tax=Photobacterium kishitanii TaxID=318456 RepID=UPI0019618C3C|nr:ASCH domain-containing protein [Photobacterium kishitanii]